MRVSDGKLDRCPNRPNEIASQDPPAIPSVSLKLFLFFKRLGQVGTGQVKPSGLFCFFRAPTSGPTRRMD